MVFHEIGNYRSPEQLNAVLPVNLFYMEYSSGGSSTDMSKKSKDRLRVEMGIETFYLTTVNR